MGAWLQLHLVYYLTSQRRHIDGFYMLKRVTTRMGKVFTPRHVQVEFEISAIRALTIELPDTWIRGCFFHFAQTDGEKHRAGVGHTVQTIRKYAQVYSTCGCSTSSVITSDPTTVASHSRTSTTQHDNILLFVDQAWRTWVDDDTQCFHQVSGISSATFVQGWTII